MTTDRNPSAQDGRAPAPEQRALEAAGAFARAGTALRHCLDEVQAADDAAWKSYSEAADAAVAHLQAELILAGAQLSAERAADHDEVRRAAIAASHLARQRLDALRVRTHLGFMDAGALAERAIEELEMVTDGLRDGSRRLQSSAAGSLEDARRTVADAIHGAGRALMVVAAAARSGDYSFEERGPAR